MNDIQELRGELKEVVKEMRQGHLTQIDILTELRVVKPQVERLENDLKELKTKHEGELEKLKAFMWKCLGVLTAASAVGWPAVMYMMVNISKH